MRVREKNRKAVNRATNDNDNSSISRIGQKNKEKGDWEIFRRGFDKGGRATLETCYFDQIYYLLITYRIGCDARTADAKCSRELLATRENA